MSESPRQEPPHRGLIVPMAPRSPDEEHRAATPLELFFDLVFVVAIAQVASRLHHAISGDHLGDALLGYGMVFFAIWWAWMNFTWFASAYDTDDVAYRLVVFMQLTGALVLAAGVGAAFDAMDFRLVAYGYVVMRVAMVAQWLRAGRADPPRRAAAWRYAAGIAVLQAGWVGWLFVPPAARLPLFLALAIGELLVPVWAERAAPTPWHHEHIVERYGLFTIIVLGESILAASVAIRAAVQSDATLAELLPTCAGGVLIVFSLWWFYFARPQHDLRESLRTVLAWGYGHLPIYAAAAAVGAGIAVVIDYRTGHSEISELVAGAAVAVPVATFLLGVWALHARGGRGWLHGLVVPVFAGAILLTPLSGRAVLLTGLLSALLVATKLTLGHRQRQAATP